MLQHSDEVAASAPATGPAGRSGMRRLLVNIGIGNGALSALYIGVLQVLLPLQVEAVDRAHKVATLGLVSGVSAVVAARTRLRQLPRRRHGAGHAGAAKTRGHGARYGGA
jgi:hypothetical protein